MRITTATKGLFLAGSVAALLVLPLGGAQAAFPAANGGIAFVNGGQITTANIDGSNPQARTAGNNPSVSPNGQTIAYDNGGQIFTIPFTSGGSTLVVGAAGTDPTWSRGGGTIAFVTPAQGLARVPSGGGALTPYTNTPTGNNKTPALSPDGTLIAFANDNSGPGKFQIWVASALGTGVATRITLDSNNDYSPSWSPDGSMIAYVSDNGTSMQIHRVSSGGGSDQQLTTGTADTGPSFSPEGDLILYSANGTLKTLPSGGGTPSPVGTLSGTLPDWQDAKPRNTSIPTISPTTTPAQGDILFASPGSWVGVTLAFTYQWQRCDTTSGGTCNPTDTHWSDISGSTSSTYTVQAPDVGPTISVRVVVTGSNDAGGTSVQSLAAGHANGLAPVNISPPTVSGVFTADPGGFVSATPGLWTGASPITFTYQWLRCFGHLTNGTCVPIPGATSSFYTPTGDDIGTQLNVAVIATNSAGKGGASSAATPYISGSPPHNHVSPTISGDIEIGSTLTTTDGFWTGAQPITFTYQWRICLPDGSDCNSIIGATGTTYTIRPEDFGSTIRMMIRGRNGAGFGYGISNHTFPIVHKTLFGPASSQAPTVAGPTRTGDVLTASPGTWTGEAPISFGFAWQRCDATGSGCKPIGGAKKATYRLGKNDVGSTIRIAVTAKNVVNTATVSSDATDAISAQRAHRKGLRIVGKPGQLVLTGTPNDDVIFAGPGNVTIYGLGGFDQIHAGSGNDVIYLGSGGSSHVWGGPGSNTIYAANGERDIIDCGKGPSRVFVDAFDIVRHCTVVTIVLPPGAAAQPPGFAQPPGLSALATPGTPRTRP